MGLFWRKRSKGAEEINELSVFDRSLEELTPDDIAPVFDKKRGFNAFDAVRFLLIFICLSVFVYCVYVFVNNIKEYQKADDIYMSISDEFFDVERNDNAVKTDNFAKLDKTISSVAIPVFSEAVKMENEELSKFYSEGSQSYNMDFERMKSKLEDMKKQNNDIVGFIYVNGTKISYPVTKYTDNDYYLNHSFDKKPLKSGTIFMDFRNSPNISENKNIVIYGHNMTNGSMFGNVSKFFKSEELFNNTPIVLYAFDGIYTFEIFSIYKTRADYEYFRTEFLTDEEFLLFAQEMKSNSIYQKDVTFDKDDIILTLSTCTNTTQIGRYALHAKLHRVDN